MSGLFLDRFHNQSFLTKTRTYTTIFKVKLSYKARFRTLWEYQCFFYYFYYTSNIHSITYKGWKSDNEYIESGKKNLHNPKASSMNEGDTFYMMKQEQWQFWQWKLEDYQYRKKLYSCHQAALCQLSYITVVEDLFEFSITGCIGVFHCWCREEPKANDWHWI